MKRTSKSLVFIALSIILSGLHLSTGLADGLCNEKFVSSLPKTSTDNAKTQGLVDGLYLVQREASAKIDLGSLKDSEVMLVNDYEFLAPEERGETSYIVISKSAFIPIILEGEPVKSNDQNGRPKLEISLSCEQIQPLEKFTRENVMKSVAIVIGGKVVTMHKIRVPIIGGKMQITRCTDHGCEALFTQLKGR